MDDVCLACSDPDCAICPIGDPELIEERWLDQVAYWFDGWLGLDEE